jgi:hypothetical protein
MRTFMQNPKDSQQTTSAKFTKRSPANHEQSREMSPALHLQHRIGNRGVQRLLQTKAEEPGSAPPGTSRSRLVQYSEGTLLHPSSAGAIQTKLTISQPQDTHEQEADRVARQVMRMPEPQRAVPCAGTQARIQAAQPSNGHERVHAKRVGSGDAGNTYAPAIVQEALHSPGRPLDAKTREFFEPRFGYDFDQVRVHTGEEAEQSASAIEAAAYTAGTDIVFGRGRYAPETSDGKHLLAHELTHTIQQGLQAQAPASVQRQPKAKTSKPPADTLLKNLKALVDKKVKDYVAYKTAITKATAEEKKVALADKALLSGMKDILEGLSFPRCVEALGRRAPTFDELKKISVVATALDDAWKASDVGVKDAVTQAHEEGGWVFMDLIDGSFSIRRAEATGTNFIKIEPFPEVENSVVVATFHTHPTLVKKPGPSSHDMQQDKRRGVPNLVAASTTGKPKDYKVFLSGPAARKHLASDTRIPGPSGGIAP